MSFHREDFYFAIAGQASRLPAIKGDFGVVLKKKCC